MGSNDIQEFRRQVLVVGAGPVGLTAALALRNLGLPATIIEAGAEGRLRPGSRAIFFHNATLKHYEEIYPGLGYTLAKNGVVWPIKRSLFQGKEVYVKKYKPSDPNAIPPFASLPQDKAEQFIFKACLDAGVEFVWNSPVKEVESDDQGVTLTTESGTVWKADYVIGADGARSVIRRGLDIQFEGPRSNDSFVVVDVKEDAENPLPLERVFHYQHPAVGGRNVLYVPFKDGWRVDMQLLAGDNLEEYSDVEGVKKWLPKVMDAKYADMITWVSTYQFYQVVANSFTDTHRRVLLAGEAAHLFAPFGARGLNSGVPDAILAARGIHAAIHAQDSASREQAIVAAAEERRFAAMYNRDCAGIALEHIQGSTRFMNIKRQVAASLAHKVTKLGRWLDEGPYGPKSGPPQLSTKY